MSSRPTTTHRRASRSVIGQLADASASPNTLKRYRRAAARYLSQLTLRGLDLPYTTHDSDWSSQDHLEFLWREGSAKQEASDLLCNVQFYLRAKRCCSTARQLYATGQRLELPKRAAPMSVLAVRALAGWAVKARESFFASGVLVGLRSCLRTSEVSATFQYMCSGIQNTMARGR